MRIAYIIHSLNNCGGIERVLTVKANYFAEQMGYEVWIITGRMKGRAPAFPLSEKIKRKDLGINDRLLINLGRLRRSLDRALEQIHPDIAVSVGGNDLFVLPKCGDGSIKVAEFHFSHDKFRLKYGKNLYAAMRTRGLEKAAARFKAFIVLTKEDQARWIHSVPQTVQIYNPLTFIPEGCAALENRSCMAAGRLEPQKNFSDLITAWKKVDSRHPGWTLDIFGDGAEKEKLSSQIHQAGLDGKVRLRGHSDRIREELMGHSCLVMSSRFEGFPMILLEAASCGVPMVSYDCSSGPSELIVDGKDGFLVRCGDTEALSEAICRVIEMPRRPLGLAARAKAEDFRIEKIMQQWDDLFRNLL